MPTRQQEFARRLRELVRQSRRLTPQARRQVIELLEEARKRIVAELSGLDPASFNAAQRAQLKASIEQALDQFRRDATLQVTNLQEQSFRLGQATIEGPLTALGFESVILGRVSTTTLKIAQGFTADLISGLSVDAAARVNAALQRAFLGGQPLTNIIEQVGRAVGGKEFTGLFSPLGRRASTITINEVLRVHSLGAQARLEDLEEQAPGLGVKKQWHWVNLGQVPRQTHRAIDGQVKGVDEAFEVPDPVSGVIEELMFPRDPAGSASNTINCHCLLKPFLDREALRSTPADRELLQSLGIQITASPG